MTTYVKTAVIFVHVTRQIFLFSLVFDQALFNPKLSCFRLTLSSLIFFENAICHSFKTILNYIDSLEYLTFTRHFKTYLKSFYVENDMDTVKCYWLAKKHVKERVS